MDRWVTDTLVAVYPFTRQPDGNEVVIGRPDIAVYLVLPIDAMELLDGLAAGWTVGQVQSSYQQKYGEVPDMGDLLDLLEHKGFVRSLAADEFTETTVFKQQKISRLDRYHFANFPRSLAQKLFSRPMLISSFVLMGLALLAVLQAPAIMPNWNAYFFIENWALMSLLLMLAGFVKVFLHEMAHLVAARSVGVSSRLGLSNRLWVLVAETDMTGIWRVPRNKRYLPLLAGPLLDAVCASILILILFAQHHGWLGLPLLAWKLSRAMLLTYLLGILWQCYFFVRTDFYYVIANFFRCKSLMKDTEVFLRNQMARFMPSIRKVDQSHIGASEMRVIRIYALVWLIGRVAAFSSLILISVPVIWNYCWLILGNLIHGSKFNNLDVLITGLIFIPQLIGFWLWIISGRKPRR